jgi:phasin
MAEAVKTLSNPKSFAFEMPKFEIPSFEMPKMEVPAAFREVAEKSVAQAKETWDKMKAASEEATEIMEETYTTASKGASDYGLKVIDTTRSNVNAAFDFASALMGAKSFSEVIELSTAHARSSFDTMSAQTKELAALAQKVATDAAEPMKTGMTTAFKKVS